MVAVAGTVFCVAVGVQQQAAAAPRSTPCECDVARRALYLQCLHEHSLGVVVGPEDPARERQVVIDACTSLSGLQPSDVSP